MFHLSWNDSHESLGSPGEVENLLDELHKEFQCNEPTIVTVELENGDSLSIGLGRDISVLNFVRSDFEPPYFASLGNDACADGIVEFVYAGEMSEYPSRNAIPVLQARKAMRHFCRTGKLSRAVRWEEG